MVSNKNFHSIFLLVFGLSCSGFCQTYNPALNITTSTADIISYGYVEYTTTNASTNDARFTLFGDGYFGVANDFGHQFPQNSSGYETSTFFNRPYKKHFPTIRKKTTGLTGSGSVTNNKINMSGANSRIATSWSPCKTVENYFLLIFENTSSTKESGCIEYYYNDTELSLNTSGILDYNWVKNMSKSTVTGSSLYNQKLKWEFTDLKPGEQRVVYIPMMCQIDEGKRLNVGSKYSTSCSGGSGASGVSGAGIMASGSPHDPNIKVADISCLHPYHLEQQTITYTIRFQNEGDAEVINVKLLDTLDDILLDIGSLDFVDSEYPFSFTLNGNVLEIDFLNINLPGLKQSFPHTYTYDDTESFIQFKICTHPNLPQDTLRNQADIIFDNQPAIMTNISEIPIIDGCLEKVKICMPGLKITNTEESLALDLSISPNPVQNFLIIDGINDHTINLFVYNNRGELVMSEADLNKENNLVEVSNLPKGMYFLQFRNDYINVTKKVIKL